MFQRNALMAVICLSFSWANATEFKTAAQDSSKGKFDPSNSARPGICLEVLTALEKADPSLKFTGKENLMPLKRVEEELESGKLDVFCGLIKNDARLPKMTFTEPAVFTIKHKVAVASDDSIDVKNFDDIRKLGDNGLIAVALGMAYVNFLEKQGGLKLDSGSKDTKGNLLKVINKRARFHYNSDLNMKDVENDAELKGKFKILPAVFAVEDQMMVYSKKLAKDSQDKITAALIKIKKSGELAAINKKYLTD